MHERSRGSCLVTDDRPNAELGGPQHDMREAPRGRLSRRQAGAADAGHGCAQVPAAAHTRRQRRRQRQQVQVSEAVCAVLPRYEQLLPAQPAPTGSSSHACAQPLCRSITAARPPMHLTGLPMYSLLACTHAQIDEQGPHQRLVP